jgi:hypothetical protein
VVEFLYVDEVLYEQTNHPASLAQVRKSRFRVGQAVGRLVRYIPGEIISGYMLLSGLVEGASQSNYRVPACSF